MSGLRQFECTNLVEVITFVRDHYVDQFRAFAEQERANSTTGVSELKLQLREQSGLFRGLYCVDFIKKDDGTHRILELLPENMLAIEPAVGTFGKASLSIEHLQWDDVEIRHDLDAVPSGPLSLPARCPAGSSSGSIPRTRVSIRTPSCPASSM